VEPTSDGTLDLPVSDQVEDAGALAPGQLIGRFVIRARLGEGGMGVVVAGEDADLGRAVAIKVVKPEADHPSYRARLLREAQAMARVEHPNVVRVYEVGEHRGRLFVAMELVDGVTLATWLRVQRRTWREIVALFQQIAAGLAVVHRAGLVHRDFKPDNVLVDRDGRAKVVDFGLARLEPGVDGSPALTRTGMVMGTPGYMAPEQQASGAVDARADQYSFCVALREALQEVAVPQGVRGVLSRGLAFEPSERFSSMDALASALGGAGRRRGMLAAVVVSGALLSGAVVAVIATSGGTTMTPAIDAAVARIEAIEALEPIEPIEPIDAARAVGPVDAPVVAVPIDAAVVARPQIAAGSALKPKPQPPAPKLEEAPKPERREMGTANLAAVRTAIAGLGFANLTFVGNDLDADIRELRDKLVAATEDFERGVLLYAIGASERKRGDCGAAQTAWVESRKHMVTVSNKLPVQSEAEQTRRTKAFTYMGRTWFGVALCELAAGQALRAGGTLEQASRSMFGIPDSERAEVMLALAIVAFETGDPAKAKEYIMLAGRRGAQLHGVIDTYIKAVGLTL
jgi:predicted Ser/Thr protein kinase